MRLVNSSICVFCFFKAATKYKTMLFHSTFIAAPLRWLTDKQGLIACTSSAMYPIQSRSILLKYLYIVMTMFSLAEGTITMSKILFLAMNFKVFFQNNHIQNGCRLNVFTGLMQSNTLLSPSNTVGNFLYNNNVVSSGFINNDNNNKISNNFINNVISTTDFQQNDVKVPCVGISTLSWASQPTLYLGAYCVVINGFDNFGAVQLQPLLGYFNTNTALWVYSGL